MFVKLFLIPLELIYLFFYLGFYQIINSYGLSLICLSCLTFFITCLLDRFSSRIEKIENETQDVLKPLIIDIKKKYKGRERQEQIRQLYYRYRYNPLLSIRSAFGILLQLPFLFGAYYMLSNLPVLNGESFWILNDLSKEDRLLGYINLLPVMMLIISVVNAFLSSERKSRARKQAVLISLLFFVLLYQAPSALLLYWTTNNVFYLLRTIVHKIYPNFVPLRNNHFFGTLYRVMFCVVIVTAAVGFSSSSLFFNNPSDFESSYWTFVGTFSSTSLKVALGLAGIMLLFSLMSIRLKYCGERFALILVSLFVMLLVQDSFLNPKTIVLDGREQIDAWSTTNIVILFLWITVLVIPQFIFGKLRKSIAVISIALLGAICWNFSFNYGDSFAQIQKVPAKKTLQTYIDYSEAFSFSKNRNVIVILTDTFSGTVAKDIMKEPEYRELFKDFTLLSDYSCVFPTTIVSAAALLSGKMYDNSIPVKEFYNKTKWDTLPFILQKYGYESNLGRNGVLFGYFDSKVFNNIHQLDLAARVSDQEYSQTVNALIFKYLIPQLKLTRINYVTTRTKSSSNSNKYPKGWDFDFVTNTDNLFNINSTKPHFFYAHLGGVHRPYNVNSKYEIGPTTEIEQSKASLKSIANLVTKLRNAGVFDNSVIMISADHPAYDIHNEASIVGLLHIPGQKGEIVNDETPLSIIDLKDWVTLAATSDIDNKSNFELSNNLLEQFKNPKRVFNFYSWDDGWEKAYLPVVTEYSINGKSYLKDSYHKTGRLLLPGMKSINTSVDYVFPKDYEKLKLSFSSTFKKEPSCLVANSEKQHKNVYSFVLDPLPGKILEGIFTYTIPSPSASTAEPKIVKKKIRQFSKGLIEGNVPYQACIKSFNVEEKDLSKDAIEILNPNDLPYNAQHEGWSNFEGSHTWSISNKPFVEIKLPNGVYESIIKISPFINSKQSSQLVSIYIDDKKCADIKLDKLVESVCELDLRNKDSSKILFTLHSPLFSPIELGINKDKRKLGFSFKSIILKIKIN